MWIPSFVAGYFYWSVQSLINETSETTGVSPLVDSVNLHSSSFPVNPDGITPGAAISDENAAAERSAGVFPVLIASEAVPAPVFVQLAKTLDQSKLSTVLSTVEP